MSTWNESKRDCFMCPLSARSTEKITKVAAFVRAPEEFFETRAAVARDFTFDGMRFLRTVQCADGEVAFCINRKVPSKCDLRQLLL
jgi:hypothetical protein